MKTARSGSGLWPIRSARITATTPIISTTARAAAPITQLRIVGPGSHCAVMAMGTAPPRQGQHRDGEQDRDQDPGLVEGLGQGGLLDHGGDDGLGDLVD